MSARDNSANPYADAYITAAIFHLPTEIHIQILSNLNSFVDQVSASQTCILWNSIIHTPSLLQTRYDTVPEAEGSIPGPKIHKFFDTSNPITCVFTDGVVTSITVKSGASGSPISVASFLNEPLIKHPTSVQKPQPIWDRFRLLLHSVSRGAFTIHQQLSYRIFPCKNPTIQDWIAGIRGQRNAALESQADFAPDPWTQTFCISISGLEPWSLNQTYYWQRIVEPTTRLEDERCHLVVNLEYDHQAM
ncbi:hypothetical protein TWF730_006257 [Orbilia blumenaviensis]|uniref:F-box domain-containing protein n=1 Tax=Orbilia blumenaviensis TaxID=1796055 RepID=A0AAV9VEX0_9PEZI